MILQTNFLSQDLYRQGRLDLIHLPQMDQHSVVEAVEQRVQVQVQRLRSAIFGNQ
jgi:hypothetical protein